MTTPSRNLAMTGVLCDMSNRFKIQFGIKNNRGGDEVFTAVSDFTVTTRGLLKCDSGTTSMCKKTRDVKNLQTADWSNHLWWKNGQTGKWIFFKEWYNASHEKIW